MPTININETDKTLYGLNENTSDNIVFIPGSAITGESDNPVLITSYSDFIKEFGNSGVEGSYSWNYATGILLAGFPILFKRITTDSEGLSLVKNAQAEVKYTGGTGPEDPPVFSTDSGTLSYTVVERYGGSYGNSLSFSMINSVGNIIATVKKGNEVVESVLIASVGSEATNDEITEAIKLKLLESENLFASIKINLEDDFKFVPVTMDDNLKLSGGKDADEEKVLEVIATVVNGEEFSTSPFGEISDKYVYDVKYITSGGYTGTDTGTCLAIANAMDTLCSYRKDCFAIPDMPYGTSKDTANTYFNTMNTSYSAAYAPWFYMNLDTGSSEWMPPSFVFLTALADSVVNNNNPIWYPPAGVSRMQVTRAIKPEYEIGGALMNKWQSDDTQSINPIMKVRGYGYCVYGQRTLYTPTSTTSSALKAVNVRFTANEIKRRIFNVCIGLTFEQNIIYTWNVFVSRLEPLLINMKSDNGLYDYQIIMDKSTITNNDINNQKAVGIVRVSVVNAIEHFDIGFELEPYGVTFTSEDTTV